MNDYFYVDGGNIMSQREELDREINSISEFDSFQIDKEDVLSQKLKDNSENNHSEETGNAYV